MRHGQDETLAAPNVNCGAALALSADRGEARPTAQALSHDRRKWFGTHLAPKRIFHIANAMKVWFAEVTVP
jgi:hypothetical protein